MKSNKSIWLVIAGIIGCGICVVPLALPLLAGILGIPVLNSSVSLLLYGALLIIPALILVGAYRAKKQKALKSHHSE